MRWLESLGHVVADCRSWNPFSKRRRDLFGIFDLVSAGPAPGLEYRVRRICFWQVTTPGNVAARRKKIENHYNTVEALIAALGMVYVVGFEKGSTEPKVWLRGPGEWRKLP